MKWVAIFILLFSLQSFANKEDTVELFCTPFANIYGQSAANDGEVGPPFIVKRADSNALAVRILSNDHIFYETLYGTTHNIFVSSSYVFAARYSSGNLVGGQLIELHRHSKRFRCEEAQ